MSEEKIDAYTVYATTDYVDEQLNSANSSKLISHVLPIEATEENQTIFPINLETFDAANDTILVQDGLTLLLPNSGFTIENNTIVMTTPWGLRDTGSILILKNTPILADEATISGAAIENNSITLDKLSADITTELDTLKKSVSDGKSLVAGAITEKGITTATDATFETIVNNINNIITLDSVPSLEAAEITPGASNQVIAAGNYLKGDQTIKGDANLVAANIAKGKSIFGVTGTYDPGIVLNTTTCGRKIISDTSTSGTLYTTITKPSSGSGIIIIEPNYNNVIICRILVEIPSLKYVVIDKNTSYESPTLRLYNTSTTALPDTGTLSLNTDYSTTYARLTFYFNIATSGSNYRLTVFKNGTSNNVYAIYAGTALS